MGSGLARRIWSYCSSGQACPSADPWLEDVVSFRRRFDGRGEALVGRLDVSELRLQFLMLHSLAFIFRLNLKLYKVNYSTSSHNLPPHNLPLFSGSEKRNYGDLI